MAAQFVTSDSEHSDGTSPVSSPIRRDPPLRQTKSTPGQIDNDTVNTSNNSKDRNKKKNNNNNNQNSNPFDVDFNDDPFADENPNNPFKNPFGAQSFGAADNPFVANHSNNHNHSPNTNSNHNNKRTDAIEQIFEVKRSKTPEMAAITTSNSNNTNAPHPHARRHSQPVNSMNPFNNMNLDEIFADFQPGAAAITNNAGESAKPTPSSSSSVSAAVPGPVGSGDKKRSKSVVIGNTALITATAGNNKRRGSLQRKTSATSPSGEQIAIAHKTGYDMSYFVDKEIAYKYLCIICENVCRNVVELACKNKRHLCCEYCIKKYFDIHGNQCPVHPEHHNLQYASSKYLKYHIEALKVRCPYSTASGIHGGCPWSDTLKHLAVHQREHQEFIRCPFAEYGCAAKLKIEQPPQSTSSSENDADGDGDGDDPNHNDDDNNKQQQRKQQQKAVRETLEQHLIRNQHQHLVLLLRETKRLNERLNGKNKVIETLSARNANISHRLQYVCASQRINDDDCNIWMLCGSHKFWKHKYNQLFTVNLQNEQRTQIRIYDLDKIGHAASVTSNVTSNGGGSGSGTSASAAAYDPTQTDLWDVGDLGVAHVSNRFEMPVWMMKKYPHLDTFNRQRFDSIIFRVGGHLIRDKKVTNRCDAILLDNHFVPSSHSVFAAQHHSVSQSAIPMRTLTGYKLDCFPVLPTKRYNCECVYSLRHGLIVVGGSGIDKNQINLVNQLKISDADVRITYPNSAQPVIKNGGDDEKSGNNSSSKDDDDGFRDSMTRLARKTHYPLSSQFNITLEWQSLCPILRAREDTALCLFRDKNMSWKEYIMICGGWSNGCLRTCELYNFEANKWIPMPPMHCKHNAAGIAEWRHRNAVVVVGGFNTEAHFTAEFFDLVKQKWIRLPNTNYKHRYKPAVWLKQTQSLSPFPAADNDPHRYHPHIICCAGSGVLKNEVGCVEYLDTRDNKWTTVKKPLTSYLGLGANINANNWRMW
eukprot:CAMPEP_0202698716 /NCGR_PEP_ID=MMETSP1385-20130828/11954_1 /ASSEMBLY_ACC=CAM_ASM_000861 /TAXON_ID=933848 /ORGANISM="Elphidium margaritaceum" /LENGTH=982 /DNA_ID=CAMNT_0049355483 /DNA_START=35 /DNA_END=2980 /DNA_ORIENTATION=-